MVKVLNLHKVSSVTVSVGRGWGTYFYHMEVKVKMPQVASIDTAARKRRGAIHYWPVGVKVLAPYLASDATSAGISTQPLEGKRLDSPLSFSWHGWGEGPGFSWCLEE